MERLKAITDEEYMLCNSLNRQLAEEFLENSTELSDRTLYAYKSNLRIWLVWIKNYLNNKNLTEIKPREYLRFQNWLVMLGHSYSDISTKRSTISSLNNYIEVYYLDEYPMFRNCINASIKKPEKVLVNEKNPPSREEIEMMCQKLEESDRHDKYQLICYLKFVFETGCRRSESLQLTTDIVNAEKIVKEVTVRNDNGDKETKTATYYLTPKIRCKGKGKTGKVRQLKFSDYSMDWIKKWVEERGDDGVSDLFVTRRGGTVIPATGHTLNDWCSGILTKLLGRRFHPHALREAIATDVVVAQGKNIEAAKALLGHQSSETTRGYVVGIDEESDADELFI